MKIEVLQTSSSCRVHNIAGRLSFLEPRSGLIISFNYPIRLRRGASLDDACDIGAGSFILQGAIIGEEAQIDAGAVVFKHIPDEKTAVRVKGTRQNFLIAEVTF